MYLNEVKRVSKVTTRKDKFRERERYRRSFWGTVFLELVLQKMSEEEFSDAEYSRKEEPRERHMPPKKVSVAPVVQTELVRTDTVKEARNQWPLSGRWQFSGKRERVQTEWESILVWASGDYLELSLLAKGMPEISEDYREVVNFMRCIAAFSNNHLFCESDELLRKYYDGSIEKFYVERAFYRYCRKKIEEKDDKKNIKKNPFQTYDVLVEVYEYFSRANTRNAVRKNNEEGRTLAENSGIPWAGSSYYNADYYYKCKDMQQLFCRICEELAREYDTDVPDFEEIEAETRFHVDGGLSYHGVWVWMQQQNNYPAEQYGMRELCAEPPEGFLYYYRDYFNEGQYHTFENLKRKILELLPAVPGDNRECYSFTMEEKEYHNGLSYLLEQEIGEKNWEFLANFKLYRTAGCMEILCG